MLQAESASNRQTVSASAEIDTRKTMPPFVNRITRKIVADRLEVLRSERPEVDTLFHLLGRERFLEWAHSIATLQDEKLRNFSPPLPPLRFRSIAGGASESMFLWTGLKDAELFVNLFERYSTSRSRARVLDFGIGSGRIARFVSALPRFEVFGCDANGELAAWCSQNLPAINTRQNNLSPPLPFDDGMFDFVYAKSVLTHLPEPASNAFLRELVRVTAPGGILVITTHGYPALGTIMQSAHHQKVFSLESGAAARIRDEFSEKPFVYVRLDKRTIELANVGDEYGNTFIHENYIAQEWTKAGVDFVGYEPGAFRNFQDAVVLKRKKGLMSL